MNYLLSRHAGAISWLKEVIGDGSAEILTHLDSPERLKSGDCIFGTLPIEKVVALSARNIRYIHLCVTLPESLRGHELSADQLRQLGAFLMEICASSISSDYSGRYFHGAGDVFALEDNNG